MKKKILCLALAVILVLPIVFTSCSKKRSDEEILADITSASATALTLSVWLPTEAEGVTEELYSNKTLDEKKALGLNVDFLKRIQAVEDAINKLLINDYTKIQLRAISDDLYEEVMAKRFNDIKNNIAQTGKTAIQEANGYQNKGRFDENGQPELVYPDVIEGKQLDICLVRGYESYISNINDGNLYALDKYLSVNGGAYSYLNKMIKSDFLSAMKVNGSTYAIPNNHKYAEDNYQFILVNKEIFDKYENFKISDMQTLLDFEEYIKAVAESGDENIIPIIASLNDFAGMMYWSEDGEFSLVSSTLDSLEASNTLDNENFVKFVSMYKEFSEKGYISAEGKDGYKSAVEVRYGSLKDIEDLGDEYYVIKSANPVATTEAVFASMFAVSTYSANYDRAMKVLYKLESNSEIRTLLQYGIENIDYSLEYDDETDEATLKLKNTAYKMNLLYTGNEYMTYKQEGSTIDDWDYEKELNYDAVVYPYADFDYHIANNELKTLSEEIYSLIKEMSKEEFDKFIEIYNKYRSLDVNNLTDEEKEEYGSVPTVSKILESEILKKALSDYKTSN